MNLSENLKKIRKEHNLSQEELASKLNVSRQSVSKWETADAYPEMDKVLQICEMFNLSIDQLMNEDIHEVNNKKSYKNSINKYTDDFLNYITKTIDMFSSLKFKNKIKLLFEELILIVIFVILFGILGSGLGNVFSSLISFFPDNIYNVIYSLFAGLYVLACIIITIIILAHIFKSRYLDYYEIVKEDISHDSDDTKESNNIDKEKITINKKKEKIVIRDPEHTGYYIINGLVKAFLFVFKVLLIGFGLLCCMTLIGLLIGFVISFTIVKTGELFIGALLCFIGAIAINILLLIQMFNFIVNRKTKHYNSFIIIIVSLIIIGSGIGLCTIGISNFEFITNTNNKNYITDESTYEYTDNLLIDGHNLEYVESNNKDIKVTVTHSKYYKNRIRKIDDIINTFNYYDEPQMSIIKDILNDINNKQIINYGIVEMKVYTTKENIIKLQKNYHDFYQKMEDEENETDNYIEKINDLESQLETKEGIINDLKDEINEKNNTITDLETQIIESNNN